jgi:hypothetical protein
MIFAHFATLVLYRFQFVKSVSTCHVTFLLSIKELLIYFTLHNDVARTFLRFLTVQLYTFLRFFARISLKNYKNILLTIWLFGSISLGHLA